MRLCVFGLEDLDSLETAVRQSFETIRMPKSEVVQLDFEKDGMPGKRGEIRFCSFLLVKSLFFFLVFAGDIRCFLLHLLMKSVVFLLFLLMKSVVFCCFCLMF